jgi:hypothetical protein
MPMSRRRVLLSLALCLVPAAAMSQARFWEANLLDPSEILPTAFPRDPDTSVLPLPPPGLRAALESRAAWDGAIDAEGKDAYEILSASALQRLWAAPLPQTALALLWTESLARNRFRDPDHIEARLGEERSALGGAFIQGLGSAEGTHVRAGVVIPDHERQEYTWALGAGRGDWTWEYSLGQKESVEDVTVSDLDADGAGETVRGLYQERVMTHRLLLKAPLAGGRISFVGAFALGRPSRPVDQEFWFCDSSRALEGYLGYARSCRGWEWRGRGEFRESEAFTIGRRIPPGSEGLKRFHFARNHAEVYGAGGDARRGSWTLGGNYRRLDWESDPPPDAFDARRETLSFNRLGLSFIANLYGGLYKVSELVDASARMDLAEARGEWDGRLGPLAWAAGLSLYRAGFSWEARGINLSQRFISLDTAEDFHRSLGGYVLGAAPRLRASLSFRRASLEIEAAQTVPITVEVEDGRAGNESEDGSEAGAAPERPALRNGFRAQATLRAGF